MFEAKVIQDSVGPTGVRLTTMQWTYPRIILAEIDTHRWFSRNSASSRAIPYSRQREQILTNPFVPDVFPLNGPGMSPCAYVGIDNGVNITDHEAFEKKYGDKSIPDYRILQHLWLDARDGAVKEADMMDKVGCHKEILNRLLEPWMWTTTVISSTNWENCWAQRCHPAAQRQFQIIAKMAFKEWYKSKPQELNYGHWHLPYLDDEDADEMTTEGLIKISVARCAAVSYHRQGEKRDYPALEAIYDRMVSGAKTGEGPGHYSPLEHIARPIIGSDDPVIDREGRSRCGNFIEWWQHRYDFPHQNFEELPVWLDGLVMECEAEIITKENEL